MKANTLRIGNYYQENGYIYKADINDLVNLVRFEGTPYKSNMEAIKLTDELIVRLGFIAKTPLSGHEGYFKDGWYLIKNDRFGDLYYDFLPEGSSIIIAQIEFVHQLQNVFFAVEYVELSLNEPTNKTL